MACLVHQGAETGTLKLGTGNDLGLGVETGPQVPGLPGGCVKNDALELGAENWHPVQMSPLLATIGPASKPSQLTQPVGPAS